jgi:hypothetical protein
MQVDLGYNLTLVDNFLFSPFFLYHHYSLTISKKAGILILSTKELRKNCKFSISVLGNIIQGLL